MRRFLVLQLARFGDLVQTRRLVKTLTYAAGAADAVHLVVDHSLVGLARWLYPGVAVHGLVAHGAPGRERRAAEQAVLAGRDVLADLAALDFAAVYCLNFSPLGMSRVDELVEYPPVSVSRETLPTVEPLPTWLPSDVPPASELMRSENSVREERKPVVFTLAILLATTEMASLYDMSPVTPVQSAPIATFLVVRDGRICPPPAPAPSREGLGSGSGRSEYGAQTSPWPSGPGETRQSLPPYPAIMLSG